MFAQGQQVKGRVARPCHTTQKQVARPIDGQVHPEDEYGKNAGGAA
jgi:hypothetical protein